MAALVTLAEAKAHLRVLANDQDTDITMKALAASDIVIDYIKRPAHGWTDTTAPALVKAAILLVLGALFEDREGGDPISDAVKSLLHRYRDPAYA
jgi:hypothetical protein